MVKLAVRGGREISHREDGKGCVVKGRRYEVNGEMRSGLMRIGLGVEGVLMGLRIILRCCGDHW